MAELDAASRDAATDLDVARDRAIVALAARTVQRTDDALRFLATVLALLTLVMLGVWTLLTYLEPCDTASLCMMLATPTRTAWHLRARDAFAGVLARLRSAMHAAYLRHRIRAAEFDLLIYEEELRLTPERIALTRATIEHLRVRLVDAERSL